MARDVAAEPPHMETIIVAAWLVVAALLLGPPLVGAHRSEWPLRSEWTTPSSRAGTGTEDGSMAAAPTPVGQCRVCGEGGQAGYTYCRSCLTPLPQVEEGAATESRDGHPAD